MDGTSCLLDRLSDKLDLCHFLNCEETKKTTISCHGINTAKRYFSKPLSDYLK